MIHYEELWENAEKLTADLKQELSGSISGAIAHLEMVKNCPTNMYDYHVGMMIFNKPIRAEGTNGPQDPGENIQLRKISKTLDFGL